MAKIIIPMITPFKKGELDRETIRSFVSYAYENQFDGLFPGGSTGGFASLSMAEHREVLKEVSEETAGMELYAGICRNNVAETIELGKYAIDLGYRNLVSINPYYHKYSENSIRSYFGLLMEAFDSDFYVYNNPSLSGYTLAPGMVEELKEQYSGLVGIKDSGNDFSVFREFLKIKGLKVLQGKDAMLKESLEAGAHGGVCSTANFSLNTAMIAKGIPESDEASRRTKELVRLVSGYEVPAIHNFLFRKLILHEENPEGYMNQPFGDIAPPPDTDLFRKFAILPKH